MSAFSQPRGPLSGDEAMRLYVEAVRRDIQPDPLFRRRLRGTVMNRLVAEREGAITPAIPRGSQIGRLGRACLYASLATAIGVGTALAASEAATPGDALYPLKLRIEEMRMEVAPAHLQDELAVYALAQRIDELGRLVESGNYTAATDHAASIAADHRQLVSGGGVTVDDGSLAQHLARLEAVLDRVPATARQAIERVMSFAPSLQPDADASGGSDSAGGASTGGGIDEHGLSGNEMDGAHSSGAPDAELTPRAQPTPEPEATPKPERTARPEPSAEPPKPTKPPTPSPPAP